MSPSASYYHGAGNRFAIVDRRGDAPLAQAEAADVAREIMTTGRVAVDGVLILEEPPAQARSIARLRIVNADGTEAEMCGNGVRCVARYLADRGMTTGFALATPAGSIEVELVRVAPDFCAAVDLGPVSFLDNVEGQLRARTGDDAAIVWHAISVGNPHAVLIFDERESPNASDDAGAIDLRAVARRLTGTTHFPDGVNVHAVVLGDRARRAIDVRHFERGAGYTAACGTGAVACAAVAMRRYGYASPLDVRVPGGMLQVAWSGGSRARLTGPAEPIAT